MSWQFTIIDYTTNTNGVSTPIAEPVGWDGINLHLKRDEHWHGFFSYVDDSFGGLQFDGAGATILRNAYYNHGIDADVRLSISYSCGDADENNLSLYAGSFYFSSFKDYLADRCYVECSLEANKDFMNFKNRADKEVDLDSLASMDQLPQAQQITTTAFFAPALNQIRFNALLNGLQPGSSISLTGTTGNAGPFTVASAKLDFSNVAVNAVNGSSQSNSLTVSADFNPVTAVISVNQVVSMQAPATISVSGASNAGNNGAFNVDNVISYFSYTAFHVTNNTLAAESAPTVSVAGSFIVNSGPTSTIVNVVEPVLPENSGGAVNNVDLSGLWVVNNLPPYNYLNSLITVPAKAITATSLWKSPTDTIYDLKCDYVNVSSHPIISPFWQATSYVTPDWPNIISDIDETDVGTGDAVGAYTQNSPPDDLIFLHQTALSCAATAVLTINLNGALVPHNDCSESNYVGAGGSGIEAFNIQVVVGPKYGPLVNYPDDSVNDPGCVLLGDLKSLLGNGNYVPENQITSQNFSYQAVVPIENFQPNDYLWITFFLKVHNNNDTCYPDLWFSADSYFRLDLTTVCQDTPCSVYFVNEAMSRCVESYTDGDMYVYSQYFGRTNAQPVASTANGCGALEAITNGLRIRGCTMPDGSAVPRFTASMKGMFESLDAIHNIGMGLEYDTNGEPRIRVEPFDWFFPDTVIQQANSTPMLFSNVMKYSREVEPALMPGSLKVGYQQFETWNNNGLYDIFGHRTYNTQLNDHTKALDKTCKWMASDYAIEFTRRNYGVGDSDSRYDASIFILCLNNKWQSSLTVASTNCFLIYDPTSFFNTSDKIEFADTASNNTGGTWVTPVAIAELGQGLRLIWVSTPPGNGISLQNEFAPNASIKDSGGNTIIYNWPDGTNGSFDEVAIIFIGSGGAIIPLELPISEAEIADSLHIIISSNTYTCSISGILGQVPANAQSGQAVVNYPQVIFTSPSMATILSIAANSAGVYNNCNIADNTNSFYQVEQGMPGGSANIINPATVMNYRISPAHNAMRHYKNAAMAYRYPHLNNYNNATLQFAEGNGNFYAIGSVGDSCSPENGFISEGGAISPANFTSQADAYPLFYAEMIKFEYPLTWAQFVAIQANPYGLVEFFHTDEGTQQGWLAELQYKPYTGMAEFTVYPKIPS